MLKAVPDVPIKPVTEGMISENILSHYVVPEGAASYLENLHNDTLGMLTARHPFVTQASPAAAVLSCALYQEPAGTPDVVWQEGTTLKWGPVISTGAGTAFALAVPSTRIRYDTIQGYLLTTAQGLSQPRYTNITTTLTPIATSTFPAGGSSLNLISAGFVGRVWMASDSDSANKVYYSDVIPSAGITAVTGGSSFLTINANSGDKITGFARTQNVLYVFTHNGIFRVYNTQSQDNTPLANVGAFSQEAIVRAKNGFYFYHPSGIYFLGSNGFPQEISGKIRDIVQKVPNSYQGKVFGWCDDDHVYYCLGNNFPGYQVDKSVIVRYTISTQVWTTYTAFGWIPSCADSGFFGSSTAISSITQDIYPTNYVFAQTLNTDGTVSANYVGGTHNVFVPATENVTKSDWADSSFSTDGLPIHIDYQTHWLIFEREWHLKRINGLSLASQNGAGLKFSYQTDKDPSNKWNVIGTQESTYVTEHPSFQTDKFYRIKLRVFGSTKGVSVKIGQPTIYVLDDLGFEKN